MATFAEKVEKSGGGPTKPRKGDEVTVWYRTWYDSDAGLESGPGLDPSKACGVFTFPVGVSMGIDGWDEALMDMVLGEKRKISMPENSSHTHMFISKGKPTPPQTAPSSEINSYSHGGHFIFELELNEIRASRRLSLSENMLLLSVLLRLSEARSQEGYQLPLDILVLRPADTWTPRVGSWTHEMWEHVAAYVTRNWQTFHGVEVTGKELREELLVVVDDLKRISSGAESISERYHSGRELTGDSKWRLLCLSVDVEPSEIELTHYLGEDADLGKIGLWLNRSPLFTKSPISGTETVVAIRVLQQSLYPEYEQTVCVQVHWYGKRNNSLTKKE